MKVIHIIDSLEMGGAQKIVFDLATHMKKVAGQAVHSEVIALTGSEDDYFFGAFEEQGIPTHLIRKETKLGLALLPQLENYLKKAEPDIVHTHLFAADVWGTHAADKAGVPVIVSTEHGTNDDEGRMKHFLKRRMHAGRDALIAISRAVEQYILGYAPEVEPVLHTIPNGVDIQRFLSVPQYTAQLSDTPTIVVVGRLEAYKGQEDLLRALPHVTQPYILHFIGDGSQRTRYTQLAKKLGLEKIVHFEGTRTDVEKWYATADLVIMPSRQEGFGLAAVEAMASGRTVLAANISGLQEVIDDGKTGVHVDMRDPRAVAQAIDAILIDIERRIHIGAAARTAAQNTYSLQRMIDDYIALYESLL